MKTKQTQGFCGFRAVVILHLQQAKQLASTEFQRKDKPPTWFHRELPASPLPPAPGKYPRCEYCWWCLHNKRAHDNLFCVTQDRHTVPAESVNALLSVSCLSENLREPSLIVEGIWPTFPWIKSQKINELELQTSGNCSRSMHNKTPEELFVSYSYNGEVVLRSWNSGCDLESIRYAFSILNISNSSKGTNTNTNNEQ